MLKNPFLYPITSSSLGETAKHNSRVEWREGASWLGPEACSDAEIFLRLGGNHKGGGGGAVSHLIW